MNPSEVTLNREAWLQAAIQSIRPIFLGAGYTIPEVQVSVGWPSSGGLAQKKKTIGQCWFGTASADGKPQLFISPLLDNLIEPQGVLATLVHEVCHVAAGPDAKHGPKFVKVMKKLGLEGKPTATSAGEDLIVRFAELEKVLGAFPHARIIPLKLPKTQTTRMHKAECACCGYTVRLSKKWADVGAPFCPVPTHGVLKMETPEEPEGE
jgi:hypothetical protein